MGFIIIGIVLSIVILFLNEHFEHGKPNSSLVGICPIIIILGLVAGLILPAGGYKPIQEVKTTELQALTDQTISTGNGSVFYVSINASNAYTFYTQIESQFAGENSKAYASRTISGDNVTVVEEENCKTPRITEYVQEAYSTFWSFAIERKITSYVFYVPKGTIAHEISLGQ